MDRPTNRDRKRQINTDRQRQTDGWIKRWVDQSTDR